MNLKRICALSLTAAALIAGAAFAADAPKEITVASGNSSVPNTYFSKGQHLGTEPDIWAAIAAKTGLKVNFVTGEFNTLFGYLDSGRADTVGNTITVNQYRFSEPYAYIPEKLVVHEERTDLKRLKDIDGLKCGYSAGSNGGNLFKQIAEKEGIKVELVVFDSSDLLNEAFRQGKVDVAARRLSRSKTASSRPARSRRTSPSARRRSRSAPTTRRWRCAPSSPGPFGR